MDIITNAQLRKLIEAGTSPCVSIFMPTHVKGRDLRQDPINLKNLLKTAEEQLVAKGMRGTEARDLLQPAKNRVEDAEFWTQNQSSLAFYLSPGFSRVYRLPIEQKELLVVNDRFEISPLLSLLEGKIFYVLAVSNDSVRLLECTPHSCRNLKLPDDVATTFSAAIGSDSHEAPTLRPGGDSSNPSGAGGAIHGEPADTQNKDAEDRMFFFRQIDNGVLRVVSDADAPLILAAADSTSPLYRQSSNHKHILEQTIVGNPDHVSSDVLHEKALQILNPKWQQEVNDLQERFGTAYAHQLASNKVSEILPAAMQGRVDTLFVAPGHAKWGRLDENTGIVYLKDAPTEGDEDLVDKTAVQTLLTSGRVVVVSPDSMPGKGTLAAIYRY